MCACFKLLLINVSVKLWCDNFWSNHVDTKKLAYFACVFCTPNMFLFFLLAYSLQSFKWYGKNGKISLWILNATEWIRRRRTKSKNTPETLHQESGMQLSFTIEAKLKACSCYSNKNYLTSCRSGNVHFWRIVEAKRGLAKNIILAYKMSITKEKGNLPNI